MAAGTSTPTEAGSGKSVLGIAAGIGAKIRDAAEEAKQEREKAQEKGMETKKGSLFKSALGNKFNPVKSNRAKAQWSKQFDWNKKSPDTAQEVKTPSETGGAEGKAKLKEFIAGGFTAIIKDTTAMRAKMDGIQSLSNANLEQSTRTTGSLTMIKDSVDAQTEIRRKALEQAKFAKSERRLERTKDSAGLTGTKGKGGSAEKNPGDTPSDDKGGGWLSWLTGALGIGDLAANFMPKGGMKPLLSKLNPMNWFKKSPTTKGGAPITSSATRATNTGAKVTTTAGREVAEQGGKQALKNFFKNVPVKMAALNFAIDMAVGESVDRALAGLAGNAAGAAYGAALFAPVPVPGARVVGAILGGILGEEAMKAIATFLSKVGRFKFDNFMAAENARREAIKAGATEKNMTPGDIEALVSGSRIKDVGGSGSFNNIPDMYNDPLGLRSGPMAGLSEGGIIPGSVPLNRGGIVDNPTKTSLFPGDKVIPLNRSAGKDMLSEGSGDLPMQAQAAMILGISAGMLGQSMSGSTGDSVKQKIRAASKGYGISNLNFTSNVGSGRLGKIDMNQSAENFMENMLKHFKMAGGAVAGGDKPDTDSGGGNPPAPAAAAGLKAELEADLGKGAAEMKNEIMQSGATGVVNPQEQPWCAAYVNSQLKRQGIMGSGSAMADSYSNWGAPVDKAHIKYGDVIVGDYGGGSKSHVMFAAGSPKDGAVDIIGGNQSGRVTRGRIQLTKIDYVRRASESVVVKQPGQPDPAAKPELPPATSVEREAERGGSFNLLNPMSWFGGQAQKATRGELNNVSNDTIAGKLYNRRKQQEEMLRKMRGYGGGGSDTTSTPKKKPLNIAAATALLDGIVKRDGLDESLLSKNIKVETHQLTGSAAPAPPRPAPPKVEPQQTMPPRQPVAETAAAVVAPPTQNVSKKTASAAGSFGSAIPAAKVAAGNFADFLYYDLV